MKRILTSLFLSVLILAPMAPVNAQTELQEALITERCSIIKQTLDKQRRRDLVSRINRGREYQNLIDQQQALTDRIRNNGMDQTAFGQRLNELKAAFDAFRSDYTLYDDAFSGLLNVDCKKDPGNFLSALINVRQLRQKVGEKTQKIADILALQRELIVDLRLKLEQIENAVVGDRSGN